MVNSEPRAFGFWIHAAEEERLGRGRKQIGAWQQRHTQDSPSLRAGVPLSNTHASQSTNSKKTTYA